jgi:hypothetical protein
MSVVPEKTGSSPHHQYQGETTMSSRSAEILETPIWVLAVRVAQVVGALIVLGLCAALITDAGGSYLDEINLGVAIPVLTWIAVAYVVLTEKIAVLNVAYHIIAVLSVDTLMVILWLATFASIASLRNKIGDVPDISSSVSACLDDPAGCFGYRKRSTLSKRGGVLTYQEILDLMAAAAGLGALVWVLYLVTYVWMIMTFIKARKQGHFQMNMGTTESHQMQTTPPAPVQVQPQPAHQPLTQNPTAMAPQGQQPNYYPSPEQQQPMHPHMTGPDHYTPTPPPPGSELDGSGYAHQAR